MKKVMFYTMLMILAIVCNPWPVEAKEAVEQQDIKEVTFDDVYDTFKEEVEELQKEGEITYAYHEFSKDSEYGYWRLELAEEWDDDEIHVKIYDGDVIVVSYKGGVIDEAYTLTYEEAMDSMEG